jgi:5-methyltetrahydrofolate--homocysteine methyltransferase
MMEGASHRVEIVMIGALLANPGVILGDGAMGTMLQAAGLAPHHVPEIWNLERPEEVARVHAAYAAAGACVVQTNTFGGNRWRLAAGGLQGQVKQVNAAAVRCARAGGAGRPVLGTMGPTGTGTPSQWDAAYAEQAEALAGGGVVLFLVETIVQVAEGVSAVRAAAAAGGAVLASVTPGARGALLDGTPLEAGAEALVGAGAAVVGVNCGEGPDSLLEPCRRLVKAGLAPVLAAPSAGLPEVIDGRPVYRLDADAFARAAIQFEEAGVRFFAGCCGTRPEHIRAAASALASQP